MKNYGAATVLSIPSSTTTTTTTTSSIAAVTVKKDSSEGLLLGKSRYKFWVLAAILLLAFWSMFTGSVTLKWSAGNLTHLSDDLDFSIHDDLDILEVEEREKMVKQMWDVYTQSKGNKLPRFWQEAFQAAYEALVSDVPAVRDAAVAEIAKMSIRSRNFEPLPDQSKTGTSRRTKSPKPKMEGIKG